MTVNPSAYRLVRSGDLWFRVSGDNHCAPDGETHTVARVTQAKYRIDLTAGSTLDGRGFLFDQLAMHGRVAELGQHRVYESCERLAAHVGRALLTAIAESAPSCDVHTLAVTISPAPYATEITAFFRCAPGVDS